MLNCTHLVLHVRSLSETHNFYVRTLECSVRRYAPGEDFLSVAVGDFIVNFYGPSLHKALAPNYSAGLGHLGFEAPTRSEVEDLFTRLQRVDFLPLSNTMKPLETLAELRSRQMPGPYRFYVLDPDGYTVELHTWEGVDE